MPLPTVDEGQPMTPVQPHRAMNLRVITGHMGAGWAVLYRAEDDVRLFVACWENRPRTAPADPGWYAALIAGVTNEYAIPGVHAGGHRGPFQSQAEAEAEARRWFIDAPGGPMAEAMSRTG